MISKYEIKKYFINDPDVTGFRYDEETDSMYDKKTNEFVCTLDRFVEVYRKKSGESFECIDHDPASLRSVLRCTECGTIIFTYDDENYDPHLKCPTCTDYKTYFEFWTKEDTKSDLEKQEFMDYLFKKKEEEKEENERIKRRNGKYDWQIGKKIFYGKKHVVGFELECDDITESYLKGLRLKIIRGIKDCDLGFYEKKTITIPLSWSQFYYQFIYRHLGKCHPDLRSKWFIGKAREVK